MRLPHENIYDKIKKMRSWKHLKIAILRGLSILRRAMYNLKPISANLSFSLKIEARINMKTKRANKGELEGGEIRSGEQTSKTSPNSLPG